MFAFAAVPLALMLGMGLDYFRALSMQARLNQAADAAALAAVNTATNYLKANSASGSGAAIVAAAIAAGQAQAVKAFAANAGLAADEVNGALTPVVTLTKQTAMVNGQSINSFSASVTYGSSINTAFGPLVGVTTFPLNGASSASAQFPAYMDVYFLIDASGSMGIGATDSDQASMQAQVGCTFGCHSPWNGFSQFWPNGTYPNVRAISPPVTMRIDVVRQAVINELRIMKAKTFGGQLRVAIYEFSNTLVPIYALSGDLDGAIAAASNIDIIGAPYQGGTYASYNLAQFARMLPTPGDGGTASSRLGSVLLFTDGIQDDATPQPDGGEVDSCAIQPNYIPYAPTSSCEYNIQGFNSADCTAIKSLGYKMFTLDFIYYTTPATVASDARYAFIANTLNPSVQSNMAACATSAANAVYAMTPTDFDNGLATLVNQVLANVRLTQ